MPEKPQLVKECPAPVYMAKDDNYDTDSDDDTPESDGNESPALEKPQLALECPTPVYMAKTCQDTIESKESYALSLYADIGCLAHGIKDGFNSLGYAKFGRSFRRRSLSEGNDSKIQSRNYPDRRTHGVSRNAAWHRGYDPFPK